MKKFFVIALAAMSLAMVSCKKSVENQAKEMATQMIEAMKSKDFEKMQTLELEGQKWLDGLSEEDRAKAEKVIDEVVAESFKDLMESVDDDMLSETEGLGEAMDEAEAAVDEAQEAIEEAVEAIED